MPLSVNEEGMVDGETAEHSKYGDEDALVTRVKEDTHHEDYVVDATFQVQSQQQTARRPSFMSGLELAYICRPRAVIELCMALSAGSSPISRHPWQSIVSYLRGHRFPRRLTSVQWPDGKSPRSCNAHHTIEKFVLIDVKYKPVSAPR